MTPTASDLPDLLCRFRDRDPAAAAELIRRFEPDIRRIARARLTRFGLRHLVDSDDIAQSVIGQFFARMRTRGWEFESPDKLLRLLIVIAANRVATFARRERRQVRPAGGEDDSPEGIGGQPDTAPAVDRVAAARDQLAWILRVLAPDDREVFLARAAGREWAELAAERGIGTDALRKRFTRALNDAGFQLGMGDPSA